PAFLLDGAHNSHAARALAAFLAEFHPQGVWMIFAVMADKDVAEMMRILGPCVSRWIFPRVDYPRALAPEKLAETIPGSVVRGNVRAAIEYARQEAPGGATVVICGSLYLIGEVLQMGLTESPS